LIFTNKNFFLHVLGVSIMKILQYSHQKHYIFTTETDFNVPSLIILMYQVWESLQKARALLSLKAYTESMPQVPGMSGNEWVIHAGRDPQLDPEPV
jgi:hypothetical protein